MENIHIDKHQLPATKSPSPITTKEPGFLQNQAVDRSRKKPRIPLATMHVDNTPSSGNRTPVSWNYTSVFRNYKRETMNHDVIK